MQINTLKSCQDANYDNVAVLINKFVANDAFCCFWKEPSFHESRIYVNFDSTFTTEVIFNLFLNSLTTEIIVILRYYYC